LIKKIHLFFSKNVELIFISTNQIILRHVLIVKKPENRKELGRTTFHNGRMSDE